jgi:His/Glu/Gln/Arg/opine family amino acid ABC transporter permease subunit
VIVLSLGFALLVALGGMSRWRLLRWTIKAYIELMRGTPLLLQLIYIYYVLPEIGIRLDAFTAGVIGLTLNYSAYISEVYRGGILAVPKGQHDAAAALGMTRALAMRRIVLPQAIRIVIPTLGNYFISLFKDTALCSVVSIQEVVFTAQIVAARNFQYFTLYTVVGAMYFLVSFPAARLVGWLERRTRSGYRRRSARLG